MPVTPIAQMLVELGKPSASGAKPLGDAAPVDCSKSCRREESVRAELDKARARAYAEGYESGMSKRVQSEQEIVTRLDAEQEVRLAALASEMCSKLEEGLRQLHLQVSSSAAQVFAKFFLGRIKEEAIEAVVTELRSILSHRDATRVIIRGPKHWVDKLTALPEVSNMADKIEIRPSEQVDVSIVIDQTTLETAVGAWLDGIGEAT